MPTSRGHAIRPLRLVPAIAWAAAVWFFSSLSEPPGGEALDVPYGDKAAHFFLFFVQAGLFRFAGLSGRAAFAVTLALGALDELHQAFVPGRSPDALDLVADAAGAVLGAWAVGWAARRGKRAR